MIGEFIDNIRESLGTALEGVNMNGFLIMVLVGEVFWYFVGQYWSTRMTMPWTVRIAAHLIVPFIAYFFASKYSNE